MTRKSTRSGFGRLAESVTEEEVRSFLLKLTRQLRTIAPPPYIVSTRNQIEAQVADITEAPNTKPALL